MRFAYPWALLLAPLAWAVAAAAVLRGRSAALAYPAGELARAAKASLRARLAREGPILMIAAALTLAAAALARPQSVKTLPADDGRGVDIMLAVDSSLSMSADDLSPSRLGAAKAIATAFIKGRVSDRIGLVTFGGAPLLMCPPTTDYEALVERLDDLTPGITKSDGTAIGDGLVAAARYLKDATAKSKVIILMTDGRSNTGAVDPLTAAKAVAAYGIRVYAIGTAGRGPAMMTVDDPTQGRIKVQIDDDLDDELLSQIADLTGGKSYRAQSRDELAKVFTDINGLEKSEIKRPSVVAVADHHDPLLALALVLLAAESGLSATAFLRWP
ncbi:MAG TPA: VWA domain-containing protein [Elusimicrobiota bacterium]|nr:VWA domain-containing protein [Elusimicrobiota bacterium]